MILIASHVQVFDLLGPADADEGEFSQLLVTQRVEQIFQAMDPASSGLVSRNQFMTYCTRDPMIISSTSQIRSSIL